MHFSVCAKLQVANWSSQFSSFFCKKVEKTSSLLLQTHSVEKREFCSHLKKNRENNLECDLLLRI